MEIGLGGALTRGADRGADPQARLGHRRMAWSWQLDVEPTGGPAILPAIMGGFERADIVVENERRRLPSPSQAGWEATMRGRRATL